MIYYFCGHKGSGKTYLANQITKETAIKMIDTGPLIRKIYREHNQRNLSFEDWMDYYEKKYGEDFSNEAICRSLQISQRENYIVVGYRSLPGIQYFNNFFKVSNFKVVYIDGDYELFRHNYNEREKTNISLEEYEEIARREDDTGIREIKDFAQNDSQHGQYYYKKKNDDSIYESIMRSLQKVLEEMEK